MDPADERLDREIKIRIPRSIELALEEEADELARREGRRDGKAGVIRILLWHWYREKRGAVNLASGQGPQDRPEG